MSILGKAITYACAQFGYLPTSTVHVGHYQHTGTIQSKQQDSFLIFAATSSNLIKHTPDLVAEQSKCSAVIVIAYKLECSANVMSSLISILI